MNKKPIKLVLGNVRDVFHEKIYVKIWFLDSRIHSEFLFKVGDVVGDNINIIRRELKKPSTE